MSLSKAVLKASLVLAIASPLISPALAADSESDRALLTQQVADYSKAFVTQDAHALAGMWAEDGTFTDSNGQRYKGRIAIEQAFKSMFNGQKPVPITISVDSLRFASADVAIEDGHAVTPGSAGTTYTVVHVKRAGQWQMLDAIECQSNARASLSDLDWLIGDWQVKDGDKVLMLVGARADSPKNFIEVTYKDASGNLINKEIIGIDPATGALTSWTYHSSGGVGRAVWRRTESGWSKSARSREASGALGRATYTMRSISPDKFGLSSSNRYLSGHALGSTKELLVVKTAEGVK